jgi:hypothetical protein
MPGVAVKGRDKAGDRQGKTVKHDWFRLTTPGAAGSSDPVITVGDAVHDHGDGPHDEAAMVEGETWFRLNGSPVSRAGHKASCGDPSTGRVWFRLESGNSGYRPNRVVPSPKCNVEHIPWVMRAKGWDKGLALMERWFREKASTDKSLPPDTTTITMDWLLGFRVVFGWYEFLITPARWLVENGQDAQGNPTSPIDRLCKQLATRGLLTGQRETFDDFHETPQQLRADKRQIDVFQITPLAFRPNDLIASLAVFELFLVVAGYVEPNANGGHTIVIEKTGVFAQDDYDFNNEPGQDQPLGRWDMDNLEVYFGGDEGCAITNQSFQDYRAATGYGGDFEVYSDLKIETPLFPQVFDCTGP